MSAALVVQQIKEQLKALPLEERRAVLKFLVEDLKEDTEEKQAEDLELLMRLRRVFGGRVLKKGITRP